VTTANIPAFGRLPSETGFDRDRRLRQGHHVDIELAEALPAISEVFLWEKVMDRGLFADIEEMYQQEETFQKESVALNVEKA
jgi:hypothetical protein